MFWHELVLNGVGGRTVQEAMANVQYSEYIDWIKYKRMRGGLDVGHRMDRGMALIASKFAAYMKVKFTDGSSPSPNDFTYYPDDRPDKGVNVENPEEVFGLLRSMYKPPPE